VKTHDRTAFPPFSFSVVDQEVWSVVTSSGIDINMESHVFVTETSKLTTPEEIVSVVKDANHGDLLFSVSSIPQGLTIPSRLSFDLAPPQATGSSEVVLGCVMNFSFFSGADVRLPTRAEVEGIMGET
jgi:hypothetical protein